MSKLKGWKTFFGAAALFVYGMMALTGFYIPKDPQAGLGAVGTALGMVGLRHVTDGLAGWRTPPQVTK